ncbi:hypothetical protein JCGZ_16651 [Jatropha curcas]|uniref:Galactose oxidase-like Early set domain-containing protein n=1 Tax=Jatropha curcas TaxID=180498 RepID=A0A067JZI0_JATCU|nr:hypothetical protein JCGZ_16651 [Jatropha curcas]
MAIIFRHLLLLSVLFVSVYAQEEAKADAKVADAKVAGAKGEVKVDDPAAEKAREEIEAEWLKKDAYKTFNEEKVLGPHEMFGDPFGNPNDFKDKKIPDDFGGRAPPAYAMPVELGYKGKWEIVSENSGVSSMHAMLLPKTNKLNTDTWSSSGGLDIEGTLGSTGGFQGGANTVRYLGTAEGSDWREFPTALADRRWYSTQATLPDGAFIVVGGRDAFSYEYIPKEGQSNPKPFAFEFLRQTSDPEENNLYPFVYLSTDGNVFIFANSRSVLLSPTTNQIVREFPELPGGSRNYPASGASVLLPIKFHSQDPKEIVPAEVLICGGSAHKDSYSKAEKQIFYTALEDCGRMRITAKDPVWKRELMPTPRIMGDMMVLATGEVLILNGAKRGASGWGFAREPNFAPVLYSPRAKIGARFTELAPSTIPRMYHSTSTVLPDGKILVAGSNTNNGYIYDAMYPTELRVEKYSPPYLDAAVITKRPEIVTINEQMTYAQNIDIEVKITGGKVDHGDVRVTMYSPAFTTHGINMNQRLILLPMREVVPAGGNYKVGVISPISNLVAPVGYYMLSVVFQGVPSVTKWVQIK